MSANKSKLRARLELILQNVKQLKEDFPTEFDVLFIATIDNPKNEQLEEVTYNTFEDSEDLFRISNAVADMAQDTIEQEVYSNMVETNYGIIVLCGDNKNLTAKQPLIHEDRLYKVAGISHVKGVPHYQLEGITLPCDEQNKRVDALYESSRFIIQTSYTILN